MALGPVQAPLRSGHGGQRDDCRPIQHKITVHCLAQRAIAGKRRGKPLEQVEIGQVVVAGFDHHWRGQSTQPCGRCGKFAMARAHGQVAGADHRIGPNLGDGLREPVERGAVFGAEMQVADVENG